MKNKSYADYLSDEVGEGNLTPDEATMWAKCCKRNSLVPYFVFVKHSYVTKYRILEREHNNRFLYGKGIPFNK